jgi:hypothetical protein
LTYPLIQESPRRVALATPLACPVGFDFHDAMGARRSGLEIFIAECYQRVYEARISRFMPLFIEMERQGRTQAVVGLRIGSAGPMFLEQYLACPVEQHIAASVNRPVDRDAVVEIGNLVAGERGSSPELFAVMAAALEQAGLQWMVFTATPQVEKLIQRLNFDPLFLAEADPRKLGDQVNDWGSYYATRPRVMAGHLPTAMDMARRAPEVNAIFVRHQQVIRDLATRLRGYRYPGRPAL